MFVVSSGADHLCLSLHTHLSSCFAVFMVIISLVSFTYDLVVVVSTFLNVFVIDIDLYYFLPQLMLPLHSTRVSSSTLLLLRLDYLIVHSSFQPLIYEFLLEISTIIVMNVTVHLIYLFSGFCLCFVLLPESIESTRAHK